MDENTRMKFKNGKVYKIKDNHHIMNFVSFKKNLEINYLIYRKKYNDFTHPLFYPNGLLSESCINYLIDNFNLELDEISF